MGCNINEILMLLLFRKWLLSNKGLTSQRSAASYVSRLRRAFKLWDNQSTFLKPIESNLNALGVLCCTNAPACDKIFTTMLGYVGAEYACNRWPYDSTSDVATAVRTFHEFLASRCNSASKPNSNTDEVASLIRNVQEIELTDVFYPVQLNLPGRIASRNSKDWKASKLSEAIGITDEGSWITRTVNNIIVLTDRGIHHVMDIAEFRVGSNGILMARPTVYGSNTYATVYSYHANGSIHPFKVQRNADGSLNLASISIEHSPAISIAINSGRFPEFQKFNNGQQYDVAKLRSEFNTFNKMVTYMLMERGQNSAKGNKW
ncbi:MAG: hypothetical protein HDS65_00015 [Bacteroidales bacterium]|nr:hypothetical protein [Bacteroidales bacterium]